MLLYKPSFGTVNLILLTIKAHPLLLNRLSHLNKLLISLVSFCSETKIVWTFCKVKTMQFIENYCRWKKICGTPFFFFLDMQKGFVLLVLFLSILPHKKAFSLYVVRKWSDYCNKCGIELVKAESMVCIKNKTL